MLREESISNSSSVMLFPKLSDWLRSKGILSRSRQHVNPHVPKTAATNSQSSQKSFRFAAISRVAAFRMLLPWTRFYPAM